MKVALGTLKDRGDELVAFLEPRLGATPSLDGDAIEIDEDGLRKGVKPRHVKTYIKRFLYTNDLRRNYRIIVQGQELTIQELELGEKEEEEREKVKEKMKQAEKEEREERKEGAPEEPPQKAEKEEASPEELGAEPKKESEDGD